MKILLIEDERLIADALAVVLQKHNYSVDNAYDGEYGLDCALSDVYDYIILDVMLPKKDGLSILKELRDKGIKTPVIMLTARGEVKDRITGLNLGADDYIPKPFHVEELLARLNAISRRRGELLVDGVIRLGPLSFNPHNLTLEYFDKELSLTLKESQLFELLLTNKDTLVSKDYIIEKLWSYDADITDSHVESQVSLLRKKLLAVGTKITIKAIRRVGYRLEGLEELKNV